MGDSDFGPTDITIFYEKLISVTDPTYTALSFKQKYLYILNVFYKIITLLSAVLY